MYAQASISTISPHMKQINLNGSYFLTHEADLTEPVVVIA